MRHKPKLYKCKDLFCKKHFYSRRRAEQHFKAVHRQVFTRYNLLGTITGRFSSSAASGADRAVSKNAAFGARYGTSGKLSGRF